MNIRVLRRSAAALASVVVIAGLAATPSAAQTAPAPAAPAAPAPAAAPPTASHLAVAREVIAASGLGRNFEFLVPQMMDQLRNSFGQTRPEIMDELTKTMLALKPEFDAQREEVWSAASRVYATYLTEPELKEIAAFFKSPAGVRYVTTQPPLLDRLYSEMQAWTRKVSDTMLARVRAEMKKKNIEM